MRSVNLRPVVLCIGIAGTAIAADNLDTPAVGWWPHPGFVEVDKEGRGEPLRRTFVLKGETRDAWTERVSIVALPAAPSGSADQVLDRLVAEQKARCEGFTEHRLPKIAEEMGAAALLWHCPRTLEGRGEVGTHKVLAGPDQAYLLTAQGDFAPYEEGATPLRRDQLDRWGAFLTTFNLCRDWTSSGCAPDPAHYLNGSIATMTEEETAQADLAEARGAEMYRQDQLAWHATDFARARRIRFSGKEGGFVALPAQGPGGAVYFMRGATAKSGFSAVEFDANSRPALLPKAHKLPAEAALRYAALQVARKGSFPTCSPAVNTVVFPTEEADGWWVYFLSSTTEPGVMLLGGHTRLRIDSEATRIVSLEPLANSCLALSLERLEDAKPSAEHQGWLMATHLVTEVPLETHVLQSLTFEVPLIVITARAVWKVDAGRIAKIAGAAPQ